MTGHSVHASELLLFFTLLQLAIIVLAARAGGALAQHLGQAAVVGEVLMALFSTVITSPALRRWLPRLQPQADAAQPAALGERG